MKLGNWIKNNKIKVLIITMPNALVKQESIKKIMKRLNLKKGKDWDFLKATTRSTDTWRKSLINDFGYSEDEVKDLRKFFKKDAKWHGLNKPVYEIIKGSVNNTNKFSRGVIGNTFSVARCLKLGVDLNQDIMIMEDDACLADEWDKFIPSNFNKNWDLLYLGSCYSIINRKVKPVKTDKYHEVFKIKRSVCLHSIVIKPKMAKLLVDNYFPIYDASDEYITQMMQKYKKNGYLVKPPVLYQNIKFESDLRSPGAIKVEYIQGKGKFGPCDE